jgi:hypothetical protein
MRLKTMHLLIGAYSPDVFLETGTYMGETTRFFVGNGVPVYTVELKRWFWFIARVRLGWSNPELTLLRGDSLDAIRVLGQREYRRPLVYLDAHWWGKPPVREEVSELMLGWDEVLTIIDDCRVPGDDGYGYDSFDGQPFDLDLFELDDTVLAAYPAHPSSVETGARRGTLYLARGKAAEAALRSAMSGGLVREIAMADPSPR